MIPEEWAPDPAAYTWDRQVTQRSSARAPVNPAEVESAWTHGGTEEAAAPRPPPEAAPPRQRPTRARGLGKGFLPGQERGTPELPLAILYTVNPDTGDFDRWVGP